MPRQRQTNEPLELELRITPPDGNPITDWKTTTFGHQTTEPNFTQLILFEEGGQDTDKKLHYHGYVKTMRSKSWIRDWIYAITDAKQHKSDGNAVYFTKQPHEHTFGYIAKHGKCVIREGVPQTTIDEWFRQSKEYCNEKERDRKRVARSRDDELKQVTDEIEAELMDTANEKYLRTLQVYEVVERFLEKCHKYGYRFPTRTQLDYIVMKLMYPHNPYLVRSYYAKSFEVKQI